METDYEKQGTDFLETTKTEFKVEFDRFGKHFPGDKEERDIYNITLSRNGRKYTFKFGQAITNSQGYYDRATKQKVTKERAAKLGLSPMCKRKGKKPTAYDVLACLQTYDGGLFEDFCSDFGYDTDSITARKTYEGVRDEYLNLARLYNNDELEQMAEIQ